MRFATVVTACLLLLAACFDVSGKAAFKPDGTAAIELEIAVSLQFAALAAGMSKDGSGDPLKDCSPDSPRAAEVPPGISVVQVTRGMRGESMTCTITFNVKDPVEALKDFKPKKAEDKDPLEIREFRLTRLTDGAYAFRAEVVVPQRPAEAKPKDGAEEMGAGIVMAMMANHYITLTLSGQRVENANGDVSADGKSVTWKLPMIVLVKPPPGFRQELRANIVYEEEGIVGKIWRSIEGLWK
jgi:hypothetical protein